MKSAICGIEIETTQEEMDQRPPFLRERTVSTPPKGTASPYFSIIQVLMENVR